MQTVLIKPSHLIHIEHNLSRMQMLIWDFILAQTSPENFVTASHHKIPVATILKYLKTTRNYTWIEKALTEMSGLSAHTILKKNRRLSERFKFFESLQILDNIVHYSFSKPFRLSMIKKRSYSKIDLLLALEFKGKYASVLHQLCFDYKGIYQTPWFTIPEFCAYMGVDPDIAQDFASINFHVIKNAVKQINRLSSITIKPIRQKQGRSVCAIKFAIEIK